MIRFIVCELALVMGYNNIPKQICLIPFGSNIAVIFFTNKSSSKKLGFYFFIILLVFYLLNLCKTSYFLDKMDCTNTLVAFLAGVLSVQMF